MNQRRVSRVDRSSLALAGIAVVVCAANLWKPYHIDDTAHLVIAQWIADHPLQPMSGMLNWGGVDEPIHRTNQPHLFFYLMAGWGRLFGWSEVAQHSLLALTSIASIVLMHRIARRLVPEHALWLTALLALGPAFLVGQNMMVDVPLLACWLWFFDAVLGIPPDSRRVRPYIVAAVALSCAVLIKYSSLALLPILALAIAWDRRWAMLWVLLVPLAVLAGWSAFNVADYGGIHILQRSSGARDMLQPLRAAIAWVVILGAVTPLGAVWAVSQPRWRKLAAPLAVGLGLALIALAVLVASAILPEAAGDRLLWGLFAVNGALAAAAVLAAALPLVPLLRDPARLRAEGRNLVILFVWVAGGAGFYILLAPFSAVRHLLVVLPAILLLAGLAVRAGLSARTKLVALLFTGGVSLALAVSDFRFAQFHKDAAGAVGRFRPVAAARETATVWTSGHWGWQWYAARQGMRQIDYRASQPQPGDLFVEAIGMDRHYRKERLSLEPLGSIVQPPSLLNLACTARPSRFYMSTHDYGPWSLSRACTHRVDIYRVR